ncbi:MAG: putative Ig domain-containing protein [Thermoplasmatota archaeon]
MEPLALLALLILPLSFLPAPSSADVHQVSVSSLAPAWVKPLSGPVAVLGINLYQDAGELLRAVAVNFTDASGSGRFTSSDLAPLSRDSASGVALYIDNKTRGTPGAFDQHDTPAALSELPRWSGGAGELRVLLNTTGLPIPSNELGNNSGPDFFVVIRTSSQASDGDSFTVALSSGDIWVGEVRLEFTSVETDELTIDAVEPRAEAGSDFSVEEGSECTFYGGLSSDNVGIARHFWSFGDYGPSGFASGAFVTHTYSSPGVYTVSLNVTDPAGNSDEDTLIVTVLNVNQPPRLLSSPPTGAVQGSPYQYLMKASDPDGDQLWFFKMDGPEGMQVEGGTGLVTWVPGTQDANKAWRVVLAVTDNLSAPVSQPYFLAVQNVNDPPVFRSLPVLTALQGRPYYYQAEAEDPDHDAQLVYSLVAGPQGMSIGTYSGFVSWTPLSEQVGAARVVLAASDGCLTAYQSFEVNVTNSNDPPVVHSLPPTTAQQGVTYLYLVRASDPDGDELSFFLSVAPANMTIDQRSGLISWRPSPDQVGSAIVELEVSDGLGGRAGQRFCITVSDVNDPPVFTSSPPAVARQGSVYIYSVQATDPDGDPLVFSLASCPGGMSIHQESRESGVVEWLPAQEDVGRAQVVVTVSDGRGGVAVQGYQITVHDVNDPPLLLGGAEGVAHQGRPYFAQLRAYDPDGDELTYILLTALPDMQLDRRTGLLVWYPPTSQLGEYHLAVRITDQNGSFVDAYFNITVLPTNEPPRILAPRLLRAVEGLRFRFTVEAYDPNGDPLAFSSDSSLFVINATSGEFSFTPGAGDVGVHSFRVAVRDPEGLTDEVELVLEVRAGGQGVVLERVAGFGLAGVAGFSPWLVTVVWLVVVAAFALDYLRLRREEREDEERERRAEGRTRVRKVVARRATKCGLCRQAISIKASPDNYTCSCGTTYHLRCFKRTGRCPVCGRGRDERRKRR